MSAPLGPNMMNVTCSCGHEADIDEFVIRPLLGELPPGEFQCPKCRKAWRIVKTPLKYGHSQPNKIVPIPPVL